MPANRTSSARGSKAATHPTPAAFALSSDALLARLDAASSGLWHAEASQRLRRVGFNELPPATPVSSLHILIGQLRSVVVLLLFVGAVAAIWLGERSEGAAIATVLVINTSIGFATELHARRAMTALLGLDVTRATVLRDGHLQLVDARLLVPGDVIELHAGQRVPADGRVLDDTELMVDEAILTGESMPVAKHSTVLRETTQLADRINMVHKGTTVVGGMARVLVTATGGSTELGRMGALVSQIEPVPTPMERKLDALGRRLVWLTLAVTVLVSVLGVVNGVAPGLVLETAIALAVAAVPEGLPAVATIALAIGMWRMARRHALVRRLPVVESLGSTTVICTDKTRTLTSGEMTVVRVWSHGEEFHFREQERSEIRPAVAEALHVAALASCPQAEASGDSEGGGHDPVDRALLRAAVRYGKKRKQPVNVSVAGLLPFSSRRKLMASFFGVNGQLIAYAKGAPRQILERCAEDGDGGTLDDEGRHRLMQVNDRYARGGLRVLALAAGAVTSTRESDLRGLTFVGFVGLADPPARGVREALARVRQAGLRTVMLTGDQRLTAEAVGRELDLLTDRARVLTGRELDAMTPAELTAGVHEVSVYSRITPEHKLAIVSALQSRGEIVAMLGDGVNDAPALKKADVGVAMGGRGSDVAKEAAAIVLQDDRFETIAAAVEEGRVVFDNIRKCVFYLFSCNLAEVLVVFLAGLAGWPVPLLPLQLLWLNIVTDTFPALALALEPADADVMRRPPRNPDDAIMSRQFLRSVAAYGMLITASVLVAFGLSLRHGLEVARAVAFMTLALAQIFHLGNARSAKAVMTWPHAAANPYALAAVAISIGLQLAAVYVGPLSSILNVSPFGRDQWILVIVASAIPAVVGQLLKIVRTETGVRSHPSIVHRQVG